MISYYVSSQNPNAHLFNIRMVIDTPDPSGQLLILPTWNPGSYLIRDYAKHVVAIEAHAESSKGLNKINIEKINNFTWRCDKANGPLTIDYVIYAWDFSIRGARIDAYHAFFNGCCLFLMATQNAVKHKVMISPPQCDKSAEWKVMTTLPRDDAPAGGFGGYYALSYEELIDYPVAMGHFECVDFVAGGVNHVIAVSGKQDGDLKRLTQDLQKVCEWIIQLFGHPPPFDRYLFLLHVVKEGYGGLEHRNSSALMMNRDALPIVGEPNLSKEYISLLSLFSHEYFHAWNVKRIKPLCFQPYPLTKPCLTNQLWAFEGMTSYYDDLSLVRANIISPQVYLEILSQQITKLLRNPGRRKQTLIESSFDAWIKFYQPNENSTNATISYYLKGSLVALCIDLALRIETQDQYTLDDLIVMLWKKYGITEQGVPEDAIELMIKEMSEPVYHMLKEALYTTQELPLEKLLSGFGIQLNFRVNQDTTEVAENQFRQGSLGCIVNKNQNRVTINTVFDESAAQIAGLSAQDEIVAIDGMKVDSESFDKILNRCRIGQSLQLTIFRQDMLKTLTLTLQTPWPDKAELVLQSNGAEQRKKWLGSI